MLAVNDTLTTLRYAASSPGLIATASRLWTLYIAIRLPSAVSTATLSRSSS